MAFIAELEGAVRSVADVAGPAVVGVGHRWARGSGVVIAPGRVLTNAHNLRGEDVDVILASGTVVPARVLGLDVDGDLAVLEADTGDAGPIGWSDQPATLGGAVFALANPGGQGLRVTLGFVSGTHRAFRGPRGRRIPGAIEHTAALLPGSSGGPVVDTAGKLVGLNTHRLGDGFYLAIPADEALRGRVDALAQGRAPSRPRLGVAVAPSHVARGLRRAVGLPEQEGVLVRGVVESSPAQAAGIREGDLIVAVAGRPVGDVDSLHEALEAAAGATVEIELVRGVERLAVTVTWEPS